MNFLPDLYVRCSICGGQRFNRQTLAVKFKGRSIADVLTMPVEEATLFFENVPAIHRTLQSLLGVGLRYLPLGQSSTTLSGGEAQRIKLATELARPETGRTLYVLDEPTTGLHATDVRRLIGVLWALVTRGNTVLVVEHNLDVLLACDWLIDLGPEGGTAGGQVLFSGPPPDLAALAGNQTGEYLRAHLSSEQA
jgi:excinuclease ABC subunit A